MFSCILQPYFTLDAKFPILFQTCHSPGLFISVVVTFICKWYPILDQNSLISIPYLRLNCSKTLPLTAAHIYIPYTWEYHPPPPPPPPPGLIVCRDTNIFAVLARTWIVLSAGFPSFKFVFLRCFSEPFVWPTLHTRCLGQLVYWEKWMKKSPIL